MRLLLDITAHGFGHLAQCAPIIAALRAGGPLELLVRSGLPESVLRERLGPIAQHIASDTDFGAVMRDPVTVDAPATLARYRALHARWDDTILRLGGTMRALHADVVLSNISYIAPAAAAVAGIPCVACSSLTWSDVVQTYFPQEADLVAQMVAGYRGATRVLRLLPGTPFDGLRHTDITRPIARLGHRRRTELAERLGVDANRRMALIAFGGMPVPDPPPLVAAPDDFLLLGPRAWSETGTVSTDATGLPFIDLLASVDVVVTKPGYGTITELACCGTPSVLVARPNWPEEPWLSQWLQAYRRCLVVPGLQEVKSVALERCLALPEPHGEPPRPGGETIVVRAVLEAARQGKVT